MSRLVFIRGAGECGSRLELHLTDSGFLVGVRAARPETEDRDYQVMLRATFDRQKTIEHGTRQGQPDDVIDDVLHARKISRVSAFVVSEEWEDYVEWRDACLDMRRREAAWLDGQETSR